MLQHVIACSERCVDALQDTLAHARLKAEASDHHMRWPLVMSLAQQPAVTKVGAVTHTPDP